MRSSVKSAVAITFLAAGLASLAFGAARFTLEDEDQEVNLQNVPAKVKAAVLDALHSKCEEFEIEEIDTEVEDGMTVYDVEIELGEVDIEMEVTAEGKVLEFEVLKEDEGDEDDHDHDDHNHDHDHDDGR